MGMDPYDLPEPLRLQMGIQLPAPNSSRGIVHRAGKALSSTNVLGAAALEHPSLAPKLYQQCATVALEAAALFQEAAKQAEMELLMAEEQKR